MEESDTKIDCEICLETYKASDLVPSCKNRPDIHKACRTCMKRLEERGTCPFCNMPAPDPEGWTLIKGYLWAHDRLLNKRLRIMRKILAIAFIFCFSVSMMTLLFQTPLFEQACFISTVFAVTSNLVKSIWKDMLFIIRFFNVFGNRKKLICFCCEVVVIFIGCYIIYRYLSITPVKETSRNLD